MRKGELQFSSQFSRFSTKDQFGGGNFEGNQQRTDLYANDAQVNEGGVRLDTSLGYGLTRQVSLNVAVPLILYSHWSTKLAGTRYEQRIQGISDISAGASWWMMNCDRYPDKNISFGLHVRIPAGDANYQALYPNSLGQDFRMRPVHPAVHPGSGAWGLRPSVEGFQQFRNFTLYGTATYLFSLRTVNDTVPLAAAINPGGLTATRPELRRNATPDSYLLNIGVGAPINRLKITAFVNGRAVGVPVFNVFGRTEGFRQPGYYTTLEPGIGWSVGKASYTFSVPWRLWAGTQNNFLNQRASSDFARYSLVGSVSFRFGGNVPAPAGR